MTGRQTLYSEEIAARICKELADGKSLRDICRADDLPHESTVRLWARDDHEGFADRYLKAREIGYHAMFDEMLEIADDSARDRIVDGEGVERVNIEVINRSRLRVDTRKWMLSKALPKIYGDRITQEITGKDGKDLVPVVNLYGRPEPA